MNLLNKYEKLIHDINTSKYFGKVLSIQGVLIESLGPFSVIGDVCYIEKTFHDGSDGFVWAEVVSINGNKVSLMSYDSLDGIVIGAKVTSTSQRLSITVSDDLLGHVLDSMGNPYENDSSQNVKFGGELCPVMRKPPNALTRKLIREPIFTGIKVIDSLLPVGIGQRMGIFSGSGVGKSSILGMIARNTNADVNVIALIGERGREVREFIENDLGPEGMKKSVLVVSSSDNTPLAKIRGAYVATTIAEYFRDQGKNVMFLLDSVTRFANAQRELGLAIGEPPASRGYTPSVFSALPQLLERTGNSDKGSITSFYTVLMDGDDMDDPITDTVRGILDGHIFLNRKIAESGLYPAVDILNSISRLAPKLYNKNYIDSINSIKRYWSTYKEAEDLINSGVYERGVSASIDKAWDLHPKIEDLIAQGLDEKFTFEECVKIMSNILGYDINSEMKK